VDLRTVVTAAPAPRIFFRALFWYTAENTRGFGMQPAEKTSLYERLGGVYSIATVVDDFIDRIMVDPRLNATHGQAGLHPHLIPDLF
jgi:hypothetical protein